LPERVAATAKAPEAKQTCPNSCKQNVGFNSSGSTADTILQLQRTTGNQAVQRLIKSRSLQAKLRIGQPNDIYEQEADRVAEQVMRMPEPKLQRQIEENEDEEPIQTKPIVTQIIPLIQRQSENEEEKEVQIKGNSDKNSEINFDLEARIQNMKGSGQPLPKASREFFEPRFRYDFSKVRVHMGTEAAETSRMLNAKAYTMGNNVVLGTGQYMPETRKAIRSHSRTLPVIRLQPIGCTRQVTGIKTSSRNPTHEVTEAHNLAVQYVRIALLQVEKLQRGERDELSFISRSLDYHFGFPSAAQLKVIRNRFAAINIRLGRGVNRIYRCNRGGSCRGDQAYAAQICNADGARTRICPPFFQVGSIARAVYLIHEAAHAVGACGDISQSDAGYPGDSPLDNAYSYERFTLYIGITQGPIPFRRHISRTPPVATRPLKKGSFRQAGSSPFEKISNFQRTTGNQAVQRLIKSRALQAKLVIGKSNDIHEQEADRIAEP